MREQYIKIQNLSVAKELADFVKNELLPDTDVSADEFWKGFDKVVHDLAPKNKKLLEFRETLQQEIDLWHKKNRNQQPDYDKYKNFLEEIGYLVKEGIPILSLAVLVEHGGKGSVEAASISHKI